MLPNEFKARMISINETQSSLAVKLGVTRETVNKWINRTTIPEYAVLALEALEKRYQEQEIK